MNEEELQKLYTWIDEIPLSRPKRNITRDFSDGGKPTSPYVAYVLCLNPLWISWGMNTATSGVYGVLIHVKAWRLVVFRSPTDRDVARLLGS